MAITDFSLLYTEGLKRFFFNTKWGHYSNPLKYSLIIAYPFQVIYMIPSLYI